MEPKGTQSLWRASLQDRLTKISSISISSISISSILISPPYSPPWSTKLKLSALKKQQPYVVTNITSWLDIKVNHILNTEHKLLLCSVLRGNIEYTDNVLFYLQDWKCTFEIKITNRSYLLLGYLRLKVC